MNIWHLLAWVTICETVGITGGLATIQGVREWYPALRKPSFNPPSNIFGPVWTVLYLFMGLSAGIAIPLSNSRLAVAVFVLQLGLNLGWSFLFFKLRNPRVALVNLFLLDLAIVWTMIVFFPLSTTAGWLLAPYLAWCSFATLLNSAIVRLNPTR